MVAEEPPHLTQVPTVQTMHPQAAAVTELGKVAAETSISPPAATSSTATPSTTTPLPIPPSAPSGHPLPNVATVSSPVEMASRAGRGVVSAAGAPDLIDLTEDEGGPLLMGGSQAAGVTSISQASRDHGWGERLQLAVRSTLRVSQGSFWAAQRSLCAASWPLLGRSLLLMGVGRSCHCENMGTSLDAFTSLYWLSECHLNYFPVVAKAAATCLSDFMPSFPQPLRRYVPCLRWQRPTY